MKTMQDYEMDQGNRLDLADVDRCPLLRQQSAIEVAEFIVGHELNAPQEAYVRAESLKVWVRK